MAGGYLVVEIAVLRLGYNTNGFAHHRLEHAIAILAELGYQSVAITLDHHALNPYEPDLPDQLERVRRLLEQNNLGRVIETGARFLLDPRRKHQPTLVSASPSARLRRLDFLLRAIDLAAELGADCVSFWSGAADDQAPGPEVYGRLLEGCGKALDRAERRGVRLAFEPEPGMFLDNLAGFERLRSELAHPLFGLTLDVGHLQVNEEPAPADHIRRFADCLFNVHLEDARRGEHEHLMFGEGEIDFGPVLRVLSDCPHEPGIHVELPRHSHDAVRTAETAQRFLKKVLESHI